MNAQSMLLRPFLVASPRAWRNLGVALVLSSSLVVGACQKPENAEAEKRLSMPVVDDTLVKKSQEKIDAQSLDKNKTALQRVSQMDFTEMAMRLKSMLFLSKSRLAFARHDIVLNTAEDVKIVQSAEGDFSVEFTTGEDGRQDLRWIAQNRILFLKNDNGQWRISRDPAGTRTDMLNDSGAAWRTIYNLVEHYLVVENKGTVQSSGRSAVKYALSLPDRSGEVAPIGEQAAREEEELGKKLALDAQKAKAEKEAKEKENKENKENKDAANPVDAGSKDEKNKNKKDDKKDEKTEKNNKDSKDNKDKAEKHDDTADEQDGLASEQVSQRLAKWRERTRPVSGSGEMIVDVQTGVILEIRFKGELLVGDERDPAKLKVEIDGKIGGIGDPHEVVAPKEAIEDFRRQKMVPDVKTQLEKEGLIPVDGGTDANAGKPEKTASPDKKTEKTEKTEKTDKAEKEKADKEKKEQKEKAAKKPAQP